MKNIKELLEQAIEELPSYWMLPIDEHTKVNGLCLAIDLFTFTKEERDRFKLYLELNLPGKDVGGYCWKPGIIKPRLEWMKKKSMEMVFDFKREFIEKQNKNLKNSNYDTRRINNKTRKNHKRVAR